MNKRGEDFLNYKRDGRSGNATGTAPFTQKIEPSECHFRGRSGFRKTNYSMPSYSRTVSCESICRIVSSATATTIKSAVPEIFKT